MMVKLTPVNQYYRINSVKVKRQNLALNNKRRVISIEIGIELQRNPQAKHFETIFVFTKHFFLTISSFFMLTDEATRLLLPSSFHSVIDLYLTQPGLKHKGK